MGLYFLISYWDLLLLFIEIVLRGYSDLTSSESATGSMGLMILNAPLYIRIPIGVIYLFLFPIPFWVGFQLESAYALYKSLNLIFMYAFLPLLILTSYRILSNKNLRNTKLIFLLTFCSLACVGIAITSMETRHLSNFFVLLMVISLAINYSSIKDRSSYKKLLVSFLFVIFLIHISWSGLRLIWV